MSAALRRPGQTGPAARAHRAPTVLVLTIVMLAGLLGLSFAGTATAATAESAGAGVPAAAPAATTPTGPVEVVLESISPTTVTAGTTLAVRGRVVNRGDEPIHDLAVRLRISGEPLGTRGELAALAGGTRVHDGHAVLDSALTIAATLAPGSTELFTLTTPADQLGLDGFGVYPLGVEARGALAAGRTSSRVGLTRTFLPWVPATTGFQPTQLTWLWPLVTTPRRDALGEPIDDDGLLNELSPRGRLGQLVSEGAYLPVTWVVDPDLLDSAAALAGSAATTPVAAPVPAEGDTATPSPSPTPDAEGDGGRDGDTIAAGIAGQWLRTLADGSVGNQVVTLPYADPDLVAMHRAGLDTDLRASHEQGPTLARQVLGRAVTGDVAWPADGHLDESSANALSDAGWRAVVLDPAARAPVRAPSYTPDGRVEVATKSGPLAGLVFDRTLSDLVGSDASAPGASTLLVQRVLAETAMITAERPADSRGVLIAPPREWAPERGLAERLVTATTHAAWVRSAPLSGLRALAPDDGIARKPLTYPKAAQEAELSARHLSRVADLEQDLTTFSQVLTAPDALLPPYRRAAFRLGSTQWRGDAAGATAAADRARLNVDALRAAVELVATPVTFGSSTGTFPLTIVNRLDQAVILTLEVAPRTPRLEVKPTEPLTIRAQRREQANITAAANANGLVIVDARLHTPVGEPLGPAVSFQVSVTQIGTMGLLITVGAAVVLFGTAGYRVVRRARRAGQAVDTP